MIPIEPTWRASPDVLGGPELVQALRALDAKRQKKTRLITRAITLWEKWSVLTHSIARLLA